MGKFYFVASSHLDREWYQSYEHFRIHIAEIFFRVFKLLEESDDFSLFMADGQVSVVEDFLEIFPEQSKRIGSLARKGKLILGPWYTQPDELLVDGESHIRNLELGMEIAKKMGNIMKVGYLPDSFGHIAQMPQILNGFGIEKAFIMRGVEKSKSQEFIWEAPDGSAVKTIQNLYGNCSITITPETKEKGTGILKSADEIKKRLMQFDQSQDCATRSDRMLVTYCSDHSAPPAEFDALLSELKRGGFEIYVGSLDDYFGTIPWEEIENRKKGELREGEDIPLLRETAVSRPYLKRENHIAQKKLIRQAEPAQVLSLLCGRPQHNGFLKHAWKLLLQNHSHDSICGCGINDVHDEMMMRYRKIEQIADKQIEKSAQALMDSLVVPSNRQDEAVLMMLNTACVSCTYVQADIMWPDSAEFHSFRIYDTQDREVPFQILKKTEECRIDSDIDIVQRFQRMAGYRILMPVKGMPQCGYMAYRVHFSSKSFPVHTIEQKSPTMENEFLSVSFHKNGTFSVRDKGAGKTYPAMHYFMDDGTNGDVYAYHPVPNDIPIDSRNLQWEILQKDDGPFVKSMLLKTTMMLPACMEDEGRRSSELVENKLSYCVSLKKNSRQLEFHLQMDNHSRDHRLRLMLPTYANTSVAVADAPFFHESRSAHQFPLYHPMQTFVHVGGEEGGIAFLGRGISQYQLLQDEDKTLAVTLHHGRSRLYAWLDWRDKRFDGIQCLGNNQYEYALLFCGPEDHAVKVCECARAYTCEPLIFQRMGTIPSKADSIWSAVRIHEGNAQISALRAIDDTCIEMRISNLVVQETSVHLQFGFEAASIREVTLSGETISKREFAKEFLLVLSPAQICTLRFDLV